MELNPNILEYFDTLSFRGINSLQGYNRFMNPRNIYKYYQPKFEVLIKKYASYLTTHGLKDYTEQDSKALDFTNAKYPYILTYLTLKDHFHIEINIPLGRLVPIIPQKLNYILWLEDLLAVSYKQSFNKNYDKLIVEGLDIGTGCSCIYPLIGALKNSWSFLATENNHAAYKNAEDVLGENKSKLTNKIKLYNPSKTITKSSLDDEVNLPRSKRIRTEEHVTKSYKILPNLDDLLSLYHKNAVFLFSMCNPPFFTKEELDKKSHQSTISEKNNYKAEDNFIKTALQNISHTSQQLRNIQNLTDIVYEQEEAMNHHFERVVESVKNAANKTNPKASDMGGGELQFIKNMIRESTTDAWKHRVDIFTCMIGKKATLDALLKNVLVKNAKWFDASVRHYTYTYTEFCQGKTMRWALAWSFQPYIKLPLPFSVFDEKPHLLHYNVLPQSKLYDETKADHPVSQKGHHFLDHNPQDLNYKLDDSRFRKYLPNGYHIKTIESFHTKTNRDKYDYTISNEASNLEHLPSSSKHYLEQPIVYHSNQPKQDEPVENYLLAKPKVTLCTQIFKPLLNALKFGFGPALNLQTIAINPACYNFIAHIDLSKYSDANLPEQSTQLPKQHLDIIQTHINHVLTVSQLEGPADAVSTQPNLMKFVPRISEQFDFSCDCNIIPKYIYVRQVPGDCADSSTKSNTYSKTKSSVTTSSSENVPKSLVPNSIKGTSPAKITQLYVIDHIQLSVEWHMGFNKIYMHKFYLILIDLLKCIIKTLPANQ